MNFKDYLTEGNEVIKEIENYFKENKFKVHVFDLNIRQNSYILSLEAGNSAAMFGIKINFQNPVFYSFSEEYGYPSYDLVNNLKVLEKFLEFTTKHEEDLKKIIFK